MSFLLLLFCIVGHSLSFEAKVSDFLDSLWLAGPVVDVVNLKFQVESVEDSDHYRNLRSLLFGVSYEAVLIKND